MLAARTERSRPSSYSVLKVSVLMTLAGTLSVAGQTATPRQGKPATRPPALPISCLQQSPPSENITALLQSIHDHPTAGAYNTLGVLYAQANRVSCAIGSFEMALHLENDNWEAHYNLALALLRNRERALAV